METEANPVPDASVPTTWLLIYTAALLLVIHQVYCFTHFLRMGVPGPIPLPIFGNYLSYSRGIGPTLVKWSKVYGKHFGTFIGPKRVLITLDADLARLILIKDFPSFHSTEVGSNPPFLSGSLINKNGAPWKRGKSYLSPAFAGSNMKQMIPSINSRCNVLIDVLDTKHANEENFDTKEVFASYALDCTCCSFGIEADCQRNPDDPFLKHAKNIFTYPRTVKKHIVLLSTLIPPLAQVLNYFGFLDVVPRESLDFFANAAKKALELKQESNGIKKKNFLQFMIDAADTRGEDEEDHLMNEDKKGRVTNEKAKKIPLTPKDLIGQCMVFLLGGFDTVPRTLSFMVYALVTNPDVQKKLQEEIDEMVPQGKPVGYDTVVNMEYLGKVWCETMRKWPSEIVLSRVCTSDFSYQGLNIPAGQYTQINVWDIHHNPEYWPEPEKFDPERFSKETKNPRHPCAYIPFGAGPRICVAMKFAILESKVALIRILQKYSLEKMPQTPDLDDITKWGQRNVYPEEGIHARLVPRD